jgi:hypothetical protein
MAGAGANKDDVEDTVDEVMALATLGLTVAEVAVAAAAPKALAVD